MKVARVTTPESSLEHSAPPKPRRKWRRRILTCLIVVLATGSLLYWLVLPWIVKRQIGAALREQGFPDARFDVAWVSLWSTRIANFSAGDGDVRFASVDVSYQPLAVIRGVLDRVKIEGVEIRVVIRNGKVERPLLPQSDQSNGSAALNLPFQFLELTPATVVVDWDGQILQASLNGSIDNTSADGAVAKAAATVRLPSGELILPGGAKLRTAEGVSLAEASIDGRIASPMSMVAEIAAHVASLSHAPSELSLEGIAMRLPISINAESTAPATAGTFAIASIKRNGQDFGPAGGAVAVRDKRIDFDTHLPALPGSALSAKGWLALDEASGMNGKISATLPPHRLDDADAFAARIPALAGWKITAAGIGADAAFSFEQSRPRGSVTIAIKGADVASTAASTELKDVNGAVTVNLTPGGLVATPGAQNITMGQALLGKVDLKEASLAFRVENSKVLVIDHLSAGWLGGSVSTKNVRINTDDPKIQATLVADRLSLRDLLALTAEGRARGDGLISGPVTLRLDGSDVSFIGGQLRSQTPTGRVEVLDTQWLGETMDASDPRFTTDAQAKLVKQRILGALADFSYDRLTFDFAEEPDTGGRLSVSTHGKGTVGERPQELDFTLNFRGVNDVLKHGLQLKEWWDKLTNPEIGQ
jgi:hypothetical protein